jgi:hypothetical protein
VRAVRGRGVGGETRDGRLRESCRQPPTRMVHLGADRHALRASGMVGLSPGARDALDAKAPSRTRSLREPAWVVVLSRACRASPTMHRVFGRQPRLWYLSPPMAATVDLLEQPAQRSRAPAAIAARFQAWRERTLPQAAYQLQPNFWTPAGLAGAADLAPNLRRAVKRTEPQLTGLAYTPHRIYLMIVAGNATHEHVAKLIHCRALIRDDPDYAEQRGKRVSLFLLCDDCSPAIVDFARRQRVRILTAPVSPGMGAASALPSADA